MDLYMLCSTGTTFYYTLGENGTCMIMQFDVGILPPDFLDGANYLGTQVTDGFLCNAWEKVDFIWYYEDVLTKRPVRWDFYDGKMIIPLFVFLEIDLQIQLRYRKSILDNVFIYIDVNFVSNIKIKKLT